MLEQKGSHTLLTTFLNALSWMEFLYWSRFHWSLFLRVQLIQIMAWHWTWCIYSYSSGLLNILRPRQNGCHFADNIFKCIFLNENVWISLEISLKFIHRIQLTIFQHWFRCWQPGDKPLSEPMMVSLLMHICISWPQWVNSLWPSDTHMMTLI